MSNNELPDFITVIAPSQEQVTAQYRLQGLDRLGFAIVGPIGRHRISPIGAAAEAMGGSTDEFYAATFSRRRSPAQTNA